MNKEQVLQFFQDPPAHDAEKFNKAFELYRLSPGKSHATERMLNAIGYTKDNLKTLLYDLQQLHGIKDVETIPVKKLPVVKEPTWAETIAQAILSKSPEEQVEAVLALKFAAHHGTRSFPEISKALEDFSNKAANVVTDLFGSDYTVQSVEEAVEKVLEVIGLLPEELLATPYPENIADEIANACEGEDNTGTESGSDTGTAPAADTVKFRDEYSFLKEADCPDELKILATDKITLYNEYQEAHAALQAHAAGTTVLAEGEDVALAAKAEKAFAAGEEIKAELDHYKEHKTVLGKHPVFAKLSLQREVDAMTNEELVKFAQGIASYISKKNKAIKEAKSDDRKAKLQADIDQRNAKLALVNKKLGVNAG